MLIRIFVASAMCSAVLGCGDEPQGRTPWMADTANVFGNASGSVTTYDTPSGDECIVPPDAAENVCVRPQDECAEGSAADVIVDADGNVLDIVCLPPDIERVEPLDLEDGEIDQTANSTALIFEGDNSVFDDDLSVDGNNVVLYGESPQEAIIDGDLTLEGNNTIVRGITVTGNTIVKFNNTVMVYCVIEGNLVIEANNTTVSGCEVWGNVVVKGNNTQLNGVLIRGNLEDEGSGTVCEGLRSFSDDNSDMRVDEGELGDPISC